MQRPSGLDFFDIDNSPPRKEAPLRVADEVWPCYYETEIQPNVYGGV